MHGEQVTWRWIGKNQIEKIGGGIVRKRRNED
jgi:hypothetical protein